MSIFDSHPFLVPDSANSRDLYADELFHLLRGRGIDRFSVSALARQMKVTPAAVLQQTSRGGLLAEVVAAFGSRWRWWSRAPLRGELPAKVPRDDGERHGLRVWRALCEVARGAAAGGDPTLENLVVVFRAAVREEIDDALFRRLGREPSAAEVVLTTCLVEGVRSELIAPDPQLTTAQAEEILVALVRRLRDVPFAWR